jgi:hypothetical protein
MGKKRAEIVQIFIIGRGVFKRKTGVRPIIIWVHKGEWLCKKIHSRFRHDAID